MASTSADKERQMLGLFLVPGVYLRVLGETVRQLGHNDRALYQGLDFTADDLKANDSRIFVTDAILMAQRAWSWPERMALASTWPRNCG